jgi:hypothetical protein
MPLIVFGGSLLCQYLNWVLSRHIEHVGAIQENVPPLVET